MYNKKCKTKSKEKKGRKQMSKKFFIKSLCIFFICIFLYTTMSYAMWVTVTDENLEEALQNFETSDSDTENYEITVSNNIINITVDDATYELNYDLTDDPTFWVETSTIEQGMTYEDFQAETEKLVLPMIGYIAVANVQGIEIEDGMLYFMMSYLGNAMGSSSGENSYIIVDDTNSSGGEISTDGKNVIYVSEFGDRVMEYVNSLYENGNSISDSNQFDTYTMTVEKEDSTDTSCKLVSTLTVNMDADFSQLAGYSDQLNGSGGNNNGDNNGNNRNDDNQEEPEEKPENNNGQNGNQSKKDNTVAKINLPSAGLNSIIFIAGTVFVILAIVIGIKLVKYRDVK